MTKDEALKLALEALDCALSDERPYIDECEKAMTAIKKALAQPETPQRKPLTDEQRREVYKKAEAQLYTVPNKPWLDALIEQTEIAHGIKGDA